jgi:hypothetical protein
MSVQKILKESIEKNPLSLKEAFVEELHSRLGIALEAKMYGEEVEQFEESFDLSDLTLEELEDFMVSEEFKQLDEISVEKLDNYYKAVSKDQRLPLKRDEKEVAKRRLRTKYAAKAFYKSDRMKRDALKNAQT